jgi:hypothetical protein
LHNVVVRIPGLNHTDALGRTRLSPHLGVDSLAPTGLAEWVVFSLALARLLLVGSYLFILPLLAALTAWGVLLAARRPLEAPFRRVILALPPVIATILLVPNLVLAYLSTGVAGMPLVTILFVMFLDLWSPVLR